MLPGFLLAAGAALWAGAWLADLAAFRLWTSFEALIPSGTIFVFASLFAAERGRAGAAACTAEAALSRVDLPSTMANVDTDNAWAVFRAYLDAVAAQTTDALVPRWKDRLGGADVFTFPNAWAMAESLRLDLNSLGPFGITP